MFASMLENSGTKFILNLSGIILAQIRMGLFEGISQKKYSKSSTFLYCYLLKGPMLSRRGLSENLEDF